MTSRYIKIFFSAAAILILSVVLYVFSSAEDEINKDASASALNIKVCFFDTDEAYAEVQRVSGERGDQYVLFLPSDCDRKELRVIFDHKQLVIGSKPVVSGGTTSAFARDKKVKIKTDEGTYTVKVCSSENLPAVFINTASGGLDKIHADKEYKEKATLTLAEGGKTVLDSSVLTYIKGRGNSSWSHNEKRSYNIKFAEKTEILGMEAAKKWALISNNMDPTLMRNAIVYTAAQMTNLPYTVDFRFIDLYINGNYRGNYMLCEKIEIGENRIKINDLEKANEKANPGLDLDDAECIQEESEGMSIKYWRLPNEPDDISGGYLLEFDHGQIFETENSAFRSKNGAGIQIHSPDHITQKEMDYLSSFYDEFEQALNSPNGRNSKGRSFMEYIDQASFVDSAVINEFMSDRDGGGTSWYIFLPEGSDKFYAGPVWDFDVSMESVDEVPDCVYVAAGKITESGSDSNDFNVDLKKNLLMHLLSVDDFAELVVERSLELCDVFEAQLNGKVGEMFKTISSSAKCDRLCWDYKVTAEKDVKLSSFIPKRAESIRKYFSDIDASVEQEVQIRLGNKAGISNDNSRGKSVVIAISSTAAVIILISCVLITNKKKRRKRSL